MYILYRYKTLPLRGEGARKYIIISMRETDIIFLNDSSITCIKKKAPKYARFLA